MVKFDIKDLNVSFDSFRALKDISMQIEERQILSIIGPSNSGKTTFLRTLNRLIDLNLNFKMTGNDIALGYNLGLRYAPSDWLALGASYLGKVRADLGGAANTDAAGQIELPDEFSFGIAVKPSLKVTLELGATYTGWSSHDQWAQDSANPAAVALATVPPETWANTWRYQAGVEYAATKTLTLRAGYVYDEEPIPQAAADYLVPANDRQLFSLGAGYRWSRWLLDVSYTYLMSTDRHITARPRDGVLESDFSNGSAHMVVLSLSTKI